MTLLLNFAIFAAVSFGQSRKLCLRGTRHEHGREAQGNVGAGFGVRYHIVDSRSGFWSGYGRNDEDDAEKNNESWLSMSQIKKKSSSKKYRRQSGWKFFIKRRNDCEKTSLLFCRSV